MKKLFHPLIPLFILVLLAGKYSYDTFFSEKYDEKTVVLLNATVGAGENVSKGYLHLENKIERSIKDQIAEQGNPKELLTIFPKLDSLEAIYQKYNNQFEKNKDIEKLANLPNENYSIQNLNLQTLFTDYLTEIKQFDRFIAEKYKSYVFEENQTDKELEDKYLKGRKIEILIHVARFKAELAQIYVQAVDTLVEEYVYFPESDKYKNTVFIPIIRNVSFENCKNCYTVEIQKISSFTTYRDSTLTSYEDTTELKNQIETNVNYYFDEKGFLVIDEKDFDSKKLKLKWNLFKDVDLGDRKKPFLEYGQENLQYEK